MSFQTIPFGPFEMSFAMGLPSISRVFSVEDYQVLESRASVGDKNIRHPPTSSDIIRHHPTSSDIIRHLQYPPTSVTWDACLISKESVSNMIISELLLCDNAI